MSGSSLLWRRALAAAATTTHWTGTTKLSSMVARQSACPAAALAMPKQQEQQQQQQQTRSFWMDVVTRKKRSEQQRHRRGRDDSSSSAKGDGLVHEDPEFVARRHVDETRSDGEGLLDLMFYNDRHEKAWRKRQRLKATKRYEFDKRNVSDLAKYIAFRQEHGEKK